MQAAAATRCHPVMITRHGLSAYGNVAIVGFRFRQTSSGIQGIWGTQPPIWPPFFPSCKIGIVHLISDFSYVFALFPSTFDLCQNSPAHTHTHTDHLQKERKKMKEARGNRVAAGTAGEKKK